MKDLETEYFVKPNLMLRYDQYMIMAVNQFWHRNCGQGMCPYRFDCLVGGWMVGGGGVGFEYSFAPLPY